MSCNENKKIKLIPVYKYYKDYPEFYEGKRKYSFNKNLKLLNSEFLSEIIIKDSGNFIATRIESDRYQDSFTVQANSIIVDNLIMYSYYKYLRYGTGSINYGSLDQIEYALEKDIRKKRLIFVLSDNRENITNSVYIDWSSNRYNDVSHLKLKEFPYPIYMWEINKTTDTITTNLSLKSIKLLYTEFEGIYIYKKYKEIVLDFQYSTFDRIFFDHIEFIDY